MCQMMQKQSLNFSEHIMGLAFHLIVSKFWLSSILICYLPWIIFTFQAINVSRLSNLNPSGWGAEIKWDHWLQITKMLYLTRLSLFFNNMPEKKNKEWSSLKLRLLCVKQHFSMATFSLFVFFTTNIQNFLLMACNRSWLWTCKGCWELK